MDKIDTLNASVDSLAAQCRELRAELSKRTRTLWVAIIVGGIALFSVISASYTVTLNNSHAIERNNLKLCPILTLMVPNKGEPRATTPRGALVAERAARLAKDYHC